MPEHTRPQLLRREGRLLWSWPSGRTLPLVAGGDDGEPEPKPDPPKADPPADPPKPEADDAAAARREAAALRKRAKDAEAEVERLKAASQTDAERLAARAEAAEGKATSTTAALRKAHLRLAVLTAAPDLGIVDPKLAVRLVSDAEVAYDDETHEPEPEAVQAALAAIVKEYPHLTRSGDSDAGSRPPAEPATGKDALNDFIRGGAPPAPKAAA